MGCLQLEPPRSTKGNDSSMPQLGCTGMLKLGTLLEQSCSANVLLVHWRLLTQIHLSAATQTGKQLDLVLMGSQLLRACKRRKGEHGQGLMARAVRTWLYEKLEPSMK